MEVSVKVSGLDQLQRQLERVPREVAKKVIRKSLRKAGKLVWDAMANLAPKDTGFLSEHFGMRTRVKTKDIAGSVTIGPEGKMLYPKKLGTGIAGPDRNGARSKTISVASVARFFEFGTSKLAKKPFMTQAYEQTKNQALDTIIEGIKTALREETK